VRGALVDAVIAELAEYATLNVQLPGEDAARPHVRDLMSQEPRVRYVPTAGDYGRALITIRADHHTAYDRRTRTAWLALLTELDLKPDYERGEGAPPETITTTIDDED
jgi:hypothetical protein